MKLDSLENIIITSLELKDNFGVPGKCLITSLGLKAKASPEKYKEARYAIVNVSKNNLSKIIREFDKLPYKSYERRRPNHEPTECYFYLARQIVK